MDEKIHTLLFSGNGNSPPAYSTDSKAADKLRSRLKSVYGHSVEIGQTHTRDPLYFARFESGPSTSTEALGETYPLALCRLALVIALKRDPTTE